MEHGGQKRPSFLNALRRHGAAVLLISLAVVFLEQRGCLAPVESMGIDRFVKVYTVPASKSIFIVEITDQDYRNQDIFGGRSPLDPAVLQHLIRNLVEQEPAVVGVDIDTTDTPMPSLARDERVVWAEVPDGGDSETEASPLIFNPVLGGQVKDRDRVAIPLFPQDPDGIVRRFKDGFQVWKDGVRVPIPAMGCAVAKRLRPELDCAPEGERRFSFAGARFGFPVVQAAEILSDSPDAPWRKGQLLRGAIVLIGGRYRAARDRYVTPAGDMAGVEVIANAAQSYLPGGRAIREAGVAPKLLFDICTGTFLVFLYWICGPNIRRAFVLNLFVAPVVVMCASYVLFLALHYALGFMPVLVGMTIHELYDHAEHLSELSAEHGGRGERRRREWRLPNFRRRLR